MSKLSRDSASGAIIGFAAGAAATVGATWLYREYKDRHPPSKESHPREWAVWVRIDRKGRGYVTRDEIRSLCYRFESDEHAEVLANVLDPRRRDRITFPDFIAKFPYMQMMRKAARLKLWHRTIGLGVAGNVAGHMAQAGEADKHAAPTNMPAAVFTYYVPPHPYYVCDHLADKQRLEAFPVTYAVIEYPKLPGACKVQVEPELGLYCDIVYNKELTKVERLVPRRVAAFNDCSIRVLDGASKLSMKKNWGFGSKGISLRSFPIDSFSRGTFVDNLAIVSYVRRGEETVQYSVDAPCKNYLCFYEELLEWIVKGVNEQGDTDKWEPIFPAMRESDFPTSTWIACGAGEYTAWGAANYLQPKDEAVIIVYDMRVFPKGPSMEIVNNSFADKPAPEGMVDLHQTFVVF